MSEKIYSSELDEMSGFVKLIADNTESIQAFEIHAEDIAAQLERIADALELLSSAVQPQFKDRDATINVQAVCREA
jgi:hypothetical protein